MELSSKSEAFAGDRLEALKISAYLESDLSVRKATVDRMAGFGSIAVPYISELIRSLRGDVRVPNELLQYCDEKLQQLANGDQEYQVF